MNSELNLSNTSFTNKEFNDVYPELLNLAKQLSYRWDPTVSNESDPGVVLLKELALVLDKINYSSDKNALESMPLSVTQQRTARQLFQVLGYYPKWYVSTEVDVNLSWTPPESAGYDENNPTKVYIPAFTQIKDDSGDYVYAIPDNVPLLSDGTIETTKAIQGIVKELKINNTNLITFELLDQNRRIYFPDYNVAQNGVFIINTSIEDETSHRTYWEQKDNLYVEETGNTYYTFNVDVASNRCYVEFPIDIADLIKGGLHIYYIISAGQDGLVSVGQLNQLYASSVSALVDGTQDQREYVTLDNDNLFIQNTSLEITGKNPESIDVMYKNYSKIKGTFNTLVTLNDYNNAVFNTGKASNAVVTDRTNDVQRSYRILSQTLTGQDNVLYVQEQENGENKLSPFGLKVYALQYNDLIDVRVDGDDQQSTQATIIDKSSYDNTFEMFTDLDVEDPLNIDSSLLQLVNLLNQNKCIQHDFSNIESGKICLLKNVAEINLTVFPSVALTQLQKDTLVNDIRRMIYKKYNAHRVDFGKEINYDDLFTNIITSSDYIKNISLGQVQYFTYALYHSDDSEKQYGYVLPNAWRQVCVSDELDYIKTQATIPDEQIPNRPLTYNKMICADGSGQTVIEKYKGKHPYLIDTNGIVYYLNSDNNIVCYSTKREEFRKEILSKSILSGTTPLYVMQDNNFKFQADEDNKEYLTKNIDITTQMLFDFSSDPSKTEVPYNLKPNEVVSLTREQLIDTISYGAYIKYDYNGEDVPANSVYKLGANEKLVIYYKTEDSDTAPYTRVIYAPTLQDDEILIQPNFNLSRTTQALHGEISLLSIATMTPEGALTCSANQSIAIKERNKVVLNNKSKLYVIGDEFYDSDDQKNKYKLVFNKVGDAYVAELTGTQQLLYSMDTLTYLNILGSGTKIEIRSTVLTGDTFELVNEVVPARNISLFGTYALKDAWQSIPGEITVIGQEFINVLGTDAGDSYVIISPKFQMNVPVDIILDRDGLRYKDTDLQSYETTQYPGEWGYVDGDYQTSVVFNGTFNESNVGKVNYLIFSDSGKYKVQDDSISVVSVVNQSDPNTSVVTFSIPDSQLLIPILDNGVEDDTRLRMSINEAAGTYQKTVISISIAATSIAGIIQYNNNGQTTYDNIGQDDFIGDWVQKFVIEQYGKNELTRQTPLNNQVILTPIDKLEQEITYYQVGGEQTSTLGDVSGNWKSGGYTYQYLIDRTNIYLMRQADGSESWDVSQIAGYAVSPTVIEVNSPTQQGQTYTYTITSGGPLGPHESVIAYDSSKPLASQLLSNAPVGVNTSDSTSSTFSSTFDLSGMTIARCKFYHFDSNVFYNYNTSEQNASALVWLDTMDSFENDDSDNDIIVVRVQNRAYDNPTNSYWTSLVELTNLYEYVEESAIMPKLWEYTDAFGNTSYLINGSSTDQYAGLNDVLLSNSKRIKSWDWPIDCTMMLTIFNDSLDSLSPKLFNIRYKNSGENETQLQFNSDSDLDWSISGLAQLNFLKNKQCEVYQNQQVQLIGKQTNEAEFKTINIDGSIIDDNSITPTTHRLFLTSDFNMMIEGFDSVSTEFKNLDNEVVYPTVQVTQDFYSETGDVNYVKDYFGNKSIIMDTDDARELTFQLATPGKYSFQIKNYQDFVDDSGVALTVSFADTTGYSIMSLQGVNRVDTDSRINYRIVKKGTYYFTIDYSSGYVNVKFNFGVTKSGNEPKVELLPMQQIDTSNGIYELIQMPQDGTAEEYNQKVQELVDNIHKLSIQGNESNSDVFNYFYVPNQDKLIKNPLKSTSFNNFNHFYNPFTICKVVEYDMLGQTNIFINN